MRRRTLWVVGISAFVLGCAVTTAAAANSSRLLAAIRAMDAVGEHSLKLAIAPLFDADGALDGVATIVNLSDAVPGFTYEHDLGAQVPGTPDQTNPVLKIGAVPGNPDRGVGRSIHATFIGNPNLIGNPDLFGGFSFGMAASSDTIGSPFVTVEQAPGPPDIDMNFAIGNPDFFPEGARIHLDLGQTSDGRSRSVDVVKTRDIAGRAVIVVTSAGL